MLFAHLQGSDFTADGHVYDSEAALVASAVKEACAPRGAAKSDSAPQAATEVFYRKVSSVCSRSESMMHVCIVVCVTAVVSALKTVKVSLCVTSVSRQLLAAFEILTGNPAVKFGCTKESLKDFAAARSNLIRGTAAVLHMPVPRVAATVRQLKHGEDTGIRLAVTPPTSSSAGIACTIPVGDDGALVLTVDGWEHFNTLLPSSSSVTPSRKSLLGGVEAVTKWLERASPLDVQHAFLGVAPNAGDSTMLVRKVQQLLHRLDCPCMSSGRFHVRGQPVPESCRVADPTQHEATPLFQHPEICSALPSSKDTHLQDRCTKLVNTGTLSLQVLTTGATDSDGSAATRRRPAYLCQPLEGTPTYRLVGTPPVAHTRTVFTRLKG